MNKEYIFKRADIDPLKTLFKYRDIQNEYHKKLLFNQELYFSTLDFLNDPFEGALPLQHISEITDEEIIEANIKIIKYNNPNQVYTDEVLNALRRDLNTTDVRKRYDSEEKIINMQRSVRLVNNAIGILSLSIDPINYLMWSHYADSHKGFCVGFNIFKLLKYLDMPYPVPITYQEDIPCWKIMEPPIEYAKKYWATKGLLWEYEQEVRFLSRKYINKSLIFDIEIIDCVFLGYKMEACYVEEILKYFSNNHRSCNIYKVRFTPKLYDLEAEKVNY